MKDIISMNDMSKEEILEILEIAEKIENSSEEEKLNFLKGKIIATLFFEPSTRTKMSFESAAFRLGAQVLQLPPLEQSSVKKGESFSDTIRMVESYSDVIVVRHPNDGAARLASTTSKKPVINAGDGSNQHPSQTLLDLYTIKEEKGTLSNLSIAFVGDLKYGRTVHSLITAMKHFNPTFHFIAPKELSMPNEYKLYCQKHNIKYFEYCNFDEDVIANADIIYMTRVQKERFSDLMEYEKVKNVYILKNDMLGKARENMKILHPLPRVNEIEYAVDDNPHAYYIQQAQNGLYAREAIFAHVLGYTLEDIKNDPTILK